MNITQVQQRQMECEERQDPLMRLAYAIGLLLLMFGYFLPGPVNWNVVGLAVAIFYWIY